MLGDHPDAQLDGVFGRRDAHRLPLDPYLPVVGPIEAVEDAHQRRLAGPVLTQQGVDLSPAQAENDAIAGDHRAEALGDVSHLDDVHISPIPQPLSQVST